jgi:hypothetical protein
MHNQVDGAGERFSHRTFQARGQRLKRGSFGTDQSRRLGRYRFLRTAFTILVLIPCLTHRFLMVTASGAGGAANRLRLSCAREVARDIS